jgi:hypothetical protein
MQDINFGDNFNLKKQDSHFLIEIENNFFLIIRISQSEKGLYIEYICENINKSKNINFTNPNITTLEYYYNKRKNIIVNDYIQLKNLNSGDIIHIIADYNGWKFGGIIGENKREKITETKRDIFSDFFEINKIYIQNEITFRMPKYEIFIKNIIFDISDNVCNIIETKRIKNKIIECEIYKEVSCEINTNINFENDFENKIIKKEYCKRNNIEYNETFERKHFFQTYEKHKNELIKNNIIEKIKYQTLDLINLFDNDDNNIMLKKNIIKLVNSLKPKYIINDFPDNTPEFNIEKKYIVQKENNTKVENKVEKKTENKIKNKIIINEQINNKEIIIKFTLNDNGDIIFNNNDIFSDKYIEVNSAKIWMVGGGAGGNNIYGGFGGKTLFYKINFSCQIYILNIGKGGNISQYGSNTEICIKNKKEDKDKDKDTIFIAEGGKYYTTNESGEKVRCTSGISGGNGGDKNQKGENGFIFIKYKI